MPSRPSSAEYEDATPDKRASPEQTERRRQVRGLLVLAVAAILFAVLRAVWHGGVHSVFPRGWWRVW